MTNAELSMTCGFKLAGKIDLAGTGVASPRISGEEWGRGRWATGTGAGQVDAVAVVERTLAAGAFEEIDLFGGLILDSAGATITTLKDVTGVAVAFQSLKGIQVQIASGAGGLRVGGAATNPHLLWLGGTTPTFDVGAGGPPLAAGDAAGKVVSSTVRRIRLLNLDGTNPTGYRVALGGIKV